MELEDVLLEEVLLELHQMELVVCIEQLDLHALHLQIQENLNLNQILPALAMAATCLPGQVTTSWICGQNLAMC